MAGGGMVGADAVELARLGQEMVRAAEDLDRRRTRLTRLVGRVDWRGREAEALKSAFLRIQLAPLVDLLREQGGALREQAAQQQLASRLDGGVLAGIALTLVPGLAGATGAPAVSPYTLEALRSAGIDLSTWDPSAGTTANDATIQKVYDYYAALFLEHPELQWTGMAALIGPSFYAGFQDLADLREAADRMADLLEAADLAGGVLPPGLAAQIEALRALAGASDEQLRFFETTLLDMQQQIFLDQATQHEAFLHGGLPAIRELHEAGAIDARTVRAWELIERGSRGDAAALAEGNRLLLLREQTTIIDDEYQRMLSHDPPLGQAITYLMTATGAPSIDRAHGMAHVDPLTLRVSTPGTLSTPDDILGRDVPSLSIDAPVQVSGSVETPLPAGNIANFADRWRLIVEDTLPAYLAMVEEGSARERLEGSSVADRAEEFRILNRMDDLADDMATDWEVGVGVRFSPP